MNKIKAVIFDIDDTLYPYGVCDRAGTEAMKKYLQGIHADPSLSFEENLAKSKSYVKSYNAGRAASHNRMLYAQKMCENAGITDARVVLGLYSAYWDAYFGKMKLRGGVTDTFKMLKDNKIKIGFCTDLTANIQFRKIAALGISEYPDAIVTSEECGAEKPAAVMFERVLEKLSVPASEAVMVGDDLEKDIYGALKCGMKAVYFKNGGAEDKGADGDHFRASDFRELAEILRLISN